MSLPPLPPSDPKSLRFNKKARDFWGRSEINYIEPKEPKICNHFFEATQDGVQCNKCHFGLFGHFELKDGNLYHKGKMVDFQK